jgi:predicted HTH transcriptional regulator
MGEKSKGWHEDVARFFEKPSRESLRDLLHRNRGEFTQLDFKREWLLKSELARHMLGFANSGGGCLVIGIAENEDNSFDSMGLSRFEDKTDIENGVQKFLSTQLKFEILNFEFDASEYPKIVGKKFQVLFVEDEPRYIPFIAMADGESIRKAAIYIRRGTKTQEVDYEELQNILNRRLETNYSTSREFELDRELADLEVLYRKLTDSQREQFSMSSIFATMAGWHESERFDDFLSRMLSIKKQRIETIVKGRQVD